MSKNFVTDKLKIRGKQTVSAIALILILTFAASMASMPIAKAANVPTYAFLTVAPNPIGVGQTATLVFWLNLVPPQAVALTGEYYWPSYTITITKPDGTTETRGPLNSDPVGSAYTMYVPVAIGTYHFKFSFPGFHSTFDGNYYQPSTSPDVTLTVQQQPIASYPTYALPTGYWARPIEHENFGWNTISGNWLGVPVGMSVYGANYAGTGGHDGTGSNFNPYTTAPKSAHIVWTKPITFGGLVGGDSGDLGYYTGLSYEPKWTPPTIMNGVLYYNTPDPPRYGFTAVDLRTGQTLWWRNTTAAAASVNPEFPVAGYNAIICGQLYDYESPNQHGVIPYLWGINLAADGSTIYSMYDAVTGNWILNLVHASTGFMEMSPLGDMLVYMLDGTHDWLAMWNSSKAIPLFATSGTGVWEWRPVPGATLDWRNGIQYNVTIPHVPGNALPASIIKVSSDVILALSYTSNVIPYVETQVAYDAKSGQQLWVANRTLQQDPVTMALYGPISDGVFTYFKKETTQWYGFDIYTGKQLWGPTDPYTNGWGMYSQSYLGAGPQSPAAAYGKFYSTGPDGMVHTYDLKTGKLLWTFSTGSSGFETAYGTWPLQGAPTIADGKVYVVAGEHSPSEPLWRGGKIYCLDAETGKELWSIMGWMLSPAISDGYLATYNDYDGQIYCLGKGLTATTVSTQTFAAPKGTPVLIEGTVTDQGPGQTCLGIPAKGTPAISDASMEQWMEYLYMQKPEPTNATGVPVTLTALDPNGNTQNIGTVTSDVTGSYAISWTPPIPGLYKITATFSGTNSYFSSSGETHLAVGSTSKQRLRRLRLRRQAVQEYRQPT